MTTLATYAAFLTARWDETEKVAEMATPGPWERFGGVKRAGPMELHGVRSVPVEAGGNFDSEVSASIDDVDAAHIALHDPRATLDDLAAKRAILALHLPSVESEPGDTECKWDIDTLRLLAEPFRSHPDHPANQETKR